MDCPALLQLLPSIEAKSSLHGVRSHGLADFTREERLLVGFLASNCREEVVKEADRQNPGSILG